MCCENPQRGGSGGAVVRDDHVETRMRREPIQAREAAADVFGRVFRRNDDGNESVVRTAGKKLYAMRQGWMRTRADRGMAAVKMRLHGLHLKLVDSALRMRGEGNARGVCPPVIKDARHMDDARGRLAE